MTGCRIVAGSRSLASPKGRGWRKRVDKRLLALMRGERGATFVEFALVLLPFLLLLFGIMEIAFVFWGSYELDNATNDAGRMIRTGQLTSKSTPEQFKAEICKRVSVLVDCADKLQVHVKSYASFDKMVPPELDEQGKLKQASYDTGDPEGVVLVTTFYEWTLINVISSLSLSNTSSGNRLLRASTVFRNEPFPN